MHRPRLLVAIYVVATCAALNALPVFAGPVELVLPNVGSVRIMVPEGWTHEIFMEERPGQRRMQIDAAEEERISLTIDVVSTAAAQRQSGKRGTQQDADAMVFAYLNPMLPQAAEDKIYLINLKSPRGFGSYGRITDKKIPPGTPVPEGEYRHATMGAFIMPQHLVIFTVYSDTLRSEAYKAAIALISDGIYAL